MMIAEVKKRFANAGREALIFFWRDQHGHEVDLVIDRSTHLECIEFKSSQTFHPDFAAQISWLNSLQDIEGGTVIYGGVQIFKFQGIDAQSWKSWNLDLT